MKEEKVAMMATNMIVAAGSVDGICTTAAVLRQGNYSINPQHSWGVRLKAFAV